MKIKKIFSFIMTIMLISISCIFVINNPKKLNYCEAAYSDTGGNYKIIQLDIEYDSQEIIDSHVDRRCPVYTNINHTNSCAPLAGTVVIGYYDYTLPNLIEGFEPGYYYDGFFYYRAQSSKVQDVKEKLYDLMGTNTIHDGTSVPQFKSGFTQYVNQQGYNATYESCGSSFNINTATNFFEQEKPIVLFLNSFVYYPEVGMSNSNGELSFLGKQSSSSHVVVAYGYRQYRFYKNDTLFRSEDFLIIIFGDGSEGYLSINDVSCIDEAYAINIF